MGRVHNRAHAQHRIFGDREAHAHSGARVTIDVVTSECIGLRLSRVGFAARCPPVLTQS